MKLNRMKVLSESEIERIRDATTRILEETGVKIDSEKALELLKAKGADVDFGTGVARFPSELQADCIALAPGVIDIVSRNGDRAFRLGDGTSHFASGHNAVFFEEPLTGEYRKFTVDDVAAYARVTHHLSEVEVLGLPASPAGVNSWASLLHSLRACIENSTKPVFFSTDSATVNHFALNMAEAAAQPDGQGSYLISQFSPTSPLFWEEGAVDGTIECAERGVPVAILPEPIAGMTSPYSLAGMITVHNAEAISGVLITQLANPGAPVIWSSSWTAFDMRRSAALVGSVETSLARIGGAQVAKSYGLPLHTTAPNSDNHAHDEQNSWEKTLSAMCAAAAGNELIVNCGMYACGMSISLEQLIMDAEIAGQVLRLQDGIDCGVKDIGEELIKSVGHRGTYIMEDHTLKRLGSGEFREPLVAVRGGRDIWAADGEADAVSDANRVAEELKAKPVPQLDKSQSAGLENQIELCMKRLG